MKYTLHALGKLTFRFFLIIFLATSALSFAQTKSTVNPIVVPQMVMGPTGTLIPANNDIMSLRPCIVSGITITATATASAIYYTPTLATNICPPNTAFTGFGGWTGTLATGIITYTFSQPIISARVYYSAVNGPDIGNITTNSTGAITLTNPCGFNVSGTVVNGIYPNFSTGDAGITVSSPLPFTTIRLTNIGGRSGFVTGNPCDFSVTPLYKFVSCPKIYMDAPCYHATAAQTTTNSLFTGDVFGQCGGLLPATINGVPCNASNTTIQLMSPLPFGITINPNGTMTYPAGTLPFRADDVFFYRLRSVANPASFSDTYRVNFGINPTITTYDHNVWSTPSNPQYVNGSYNIMPFSKFNPTLTGQCNTFVQATAPGNVTVVETTSPPNSYYRIETDGTVYIRPAYVSNPTLIPGTGHTLTFKMSDTSNSAIFINGRVNMSLWYRSRSPIENKEDLNQEDLKFIIAPNPSKEDFTINFGNKIKNATIEIYNYLGQLIQNNILNDVENYKLQDLIKGIYFVKISTDNSTSTQQIVKE